MIDKKSQLQVIKSDINPRSIAIALETLYPSWYKGSINDMGDTDKVRGNLVLQSIDAALNRGYQVLVADGDSSLEFKKELANRGVVIINRTKKARSGARGQLLEASSVIPEVQVIVLTAPEKVSLVESCIPLLAKPILAGEADIVVPARDEALFTASYPDYMHDSEVDANKKYNKILHEFEILPEEENLDFFFGPTVLRNDPDVISLFLGKIELERDRLSVGIRKYVDPDDFSNSPIFAIVKALQTGLKVRGVEVPFTYPETQRENEMIDRDVFVEKRKKQKWGILDELVLYIRYLNNSNDPKNVLKNPDY